MHALPSACSLRQTEASTISPAVRHLGAQDYPFRRKRTIHFARAGFVCGQESLVLSTCGQNERFLPAYALRGGPFQRFFAHGEPFLPKTAFYGLYPAKNRSSCPEAAKMNGSSQLMKENARFGHDRQNGRPLRYNNREAPLHASPSTCSLRLMGASAISPVARHLGTEAYPAKRKRPLRP